jgi:hypothetical protein
MLVLDIRRTSFIANQVQGRVYDCWHASGTEPDQLEVQELPNHMGVPCDLFTRSGCPWYLAGL